LENARRIAETVPHLVIRVPVIPTFNDTPDEIRAIARFAASLPNVKELHLLPYHRLGQDKYTALGREYPMEGFPPKTEADMAPLLWAARESGLQVEVGG
jgi:pyruvate formate lyase activating enzyme